MTFVSDAAQNGMTREELEQQLLLEREHWVDGPPLALFKEMGRVRMAKRVRMGGLLHAAGVQGQAKGPLQRRTIHRFGGRGRALTTVAFGGKEQPGMFVSEPEFPQPTQRHPSVQYIPTPYGPPASPAKGRG